MTDVCFERIVVTFFVCSLIWFIKACDITTAPSPPLCICEDPFCLLGVYLPSGIGVGGA